MARTADPDAPPITRKVLDNCQIQEWYPNFHRLTIKTKFIELTEPFVEYLLSDGIVLPEGIELHKSSNQEDEDSWSDTSWDEAGMGSRPEQDEEEDDESPAQVIRPRFDDLMDAIQKAIKDLDGEVFPKLNWSAPRDATWVNVGENTRCMNPAEIILLLKSSDLIVHDICHAYDCCVDERENDPRSQEEGMSSNSTADAGRPSPASMESSRPIKITLALRKWFDVKSSMEFRCFVREGSLIAISQRDCSQHYKFLFDCTRQIKDCLKDFFMTEISSKFVEKSFIFDAYVRQRDWKVFVLDFNPFGGLTQPLLFSWNDLLEIPGVSDAEPELRLVGEGTQIRPAMSMYGRVPADLMDLESNPQAIEEFVRRVRHENLDQAPSTG